MRCQSKRAKSLTSTMGDGTSASFASFASSTLPPGNSQFLEMLDRLCSPRCMHKMLSSQRITAATNSMNFRESLTPSKVAERPSNAKSGRPPHLFTFGERFNRFPRAMLGGFCHTRSPPADLLSLRSNLATPENLKSARYLDSISTTRHACGCH